MKKIFTLTLLTVVSVLALLLLSSCGGKCEVRFDTDGGTNVESQKVKIGDRVIKPENPSKEGFEFVGWYYSDEKWSFIEHTVTGDITLTAKWCMGGLLFEDEGTYMSVIGYTGNYGNVVIPESYNGKPVKEIGENAFQGNSVITSVTIPSSVVRIRKNAFEDCVLLESLTIPSSILAIENNAFGGCFRLVEVYNLSLLQIEKGSSTNGYVGFYAKVIHNSKDESSALIKTADGFVFCYDGADYYLVDYKGNQTNIVLPSNINGSPYAINRHVFYKTNIESVVIPDGVTSIGNNAFSYCSSLSSVTIGSTVTKIESNAFLSCKALKNIVIPQSVKTIEQYAFFSCSSLSSVTLQGENWYVTTTEGSSSGKDITSFAPEDIARNITSVYYSYYWYQK